MNFTNLTVEQENLQAIEESYTEYVSEHPEVEHEAYHAARYDFAQESTDTMLLSPAYNDMRFRLTEVTLEMMISNTMLEAGALITADQAKREQEFNRAAGGSDQSINPLKLVKVLKLN